MLDRNFSSNLAGITCIWLPCTGYGESLCTCAGALTFRMACSLFIKELEPKVHGRGRNPESMDDLFFGVHDEMLYARKSEPIEGKDCVALAIVGFRTGLFSVLP